MENAFHLLNTRMMWENQNKQNRLKEAVIRVFEKNFIKKECNSMVTSVGHLFDGIIACKGYASKY